MVSELGQAFYAVYTSSKEILKNKNQRHLYCNTLDLLTGTCKTTGLNCSLVTQNELFQFLLSDVLALMFDEDRAIQSSAVAALEQALVSIDVADIHSSSHWPELKSAIISNYTSRINAMREAKNSNWHRIWCLLICVLDREILRGASVINSFLSIVELGFRNMDHTVRAEAFICWRLLIKIFSAYNELSSPKRMKLICIPLKSSQSKTVHAACVKFRTWWYLLNCLGEKLTQNFDNVVEPFLAFTFGIGGRGTNPGIAHQYRPAFALALPTLVSLVSVATNDQLQLQRMMREQQLEPLTAKSPLTERDVLKQHWRPILNASMEAIKLLNKYESNGDVTTESEQQLYHMLLRNLTHIMLKRHIAPLTIQLCAELENFIPEQPRNVLIVFNTIATESLSLQRDVDEVEDYKNVLTAFLHLFVKAKAEVPPSILQRVINHIYATEALHAETQGDFRLLTSLFELVLHASDEEDYDAFEVKLLVWIQLSQAILDYLRGNSLEYRLKQNSQLLDRWLLWPLQTCTGFAGRRASSSFDSAFCQLWRQLLNAGHNSLDRKQFLLDVKTSLKELLNGRKEETQIAELFDGYVSAVLKFGISKDSPVQTDVFEFLHDILLNYTLPQKVTEGFLNTLRNVIVELKYLEITILFESLKPLLSAVLASWKKQKYEGAFLDAWKRAVLDKFKLHPTKSFLNQIKDMFKGNNDFVTIPKVWSLNPEKLTDRQKERFAEKADIPALYNDMSQSQDSSIKPWTPKKIVIAKSKEFEIAIEGNDKGDEAIEIQSSEDSEVVGETPHTPSKTAESNTDTAKRTNSTKKVTSKSQSKQHETEAKTETSAESNAAEKVNTRKTRSAAEAEDNIKKETAVGRLTRQRNTKLDVSAKPETEKKTQKSPFKMTPSSPVKAQIKKQNGKELFSEPDPEPVKKAVSNSIDVFASSETEQATNAIDFNAKATEEQETETNAQCEIPETPFDPVVPNDCAKETELITAPEVIQAQETSPRKPTTRFSGLSSPPDRKLTNNSTSPTLRPKPSAHLTGRGAQLINMIRNKKLDAHSPYSLSSSLSRIQVTPVRSMDRIESATPTTDIIELTGTEQTSTPMQSKDLLVFSKRLPSPTASPSASILKRKMCYEIDESIESPAFKRKRVSFHDPPVSVTKEYVRDIVENKTKLKRCLLPDKTAFTAYHNNNNTTNALELKHALRRRSKLDSMIEIEKFATASPSTRDENESNSKLLDQQQQQQQEEDDDVPETSICTLKWNDSRSSSIANDVPDIELSVNNTTYSSEHNHTTTAYGDRPLLSTAVNTAECQDLAIMDTDTALEIVAERCSLDTLLEKYFAKQNSAPVKNASILAKFVSQQMAANPKVKTNVLETLSENHSKDFLDHAVQENLSSVVCDRLNLNSVLEYICSKSKINTNCRNNLLAEMPDILRSSKVDSERLNFIENLLKKGNFSDDNILDIIAMLMKVRERRGFSPESVSDTAVDSSSNL